MTASFQSGSAKIYQFPKGGRAGQRPAVQASKAANDFAALAAAHAVATEAWYHEAAMREDEKPRKQ